MKFKKLIAAMSAVTMLGSLAVAVPASAAETDASVVAFDNFRVNTTESKTKTEGDIKYYANAHIGSVLTGAGYSGGTITKAETVLSNRFYNLMRIAIPSGNTESVTVSFAVASSSKSFEIYSYSSDVEWKDLEYTDNSHAGNTDNDYQTYYDASIAAGYDWSGTSTNTFTATTPLASVTTASNKLEFTLDVTAEDIAAGYKDVLIKNTSGSACNITVPQTPEVTTVLKTVESPVAKIGSTEYATFKAAFEAAKSGDTITLLDDISVENERYCLDSSATSGTTYRNNVSPLTINGGGHSLTTTGSFLFEVNNKTLNLTNIDVSGNKLAVNTKGTSTLNLDAVTVKSALLASNNAGSKVNTTSLNVTDAADGVSLFTSASTLGTLNIALTEALAAEYDVVDGVLTAKAVEPTTHSEYFSFTGDENVSYNSVAVTASNGTEEQTKTASIVAITGASEIFAEVNNIPEGITITGIVLDSVE